jgi:NAD/NADP transhydrogenase alpha subunit
MRNLSLLQSFALNPAMKEQVESLGGEFLELDIQEDRITAGEIKHESEYLSGVTGLCE